MKKIILTILDGFGYREETHGNAVKMANIPTIQKLWKEYPHSLLDASGTKVGLPMNQMGNSEVGHLNIGAGRIVFQPLEEINNSIKEKSFYNNKEILKVINHVKENQSNLHIMGLLSDGGVHSHIDHLFALIDLCKKENINNVYYDIFLDGRDTAPNSKKKYLEQLNKKIVETGIGTISTISGRYYAMDRDNRWDRIELAYNAVVNQDGRHCSDYQELIKLTETNEETDEFVIPTILDGNKPLSENDGIIVFNFRPDRLRELFMAITNNNFKEFPAKKFHNIKTVTMMNVSEDVICTNAFPKMCLTNTLGEYLSTKNIHQLRIAETEKYAHVTYFFDGGVERDLKNCDRILIPSPKVATYDLKPEMSADEITNQLLKVMDKYELIILNFANCDMVGHTGKIKEVVKAIETVDKNLNRIYEKAQEEGFTLLVTADHGNCEIMLDENDNIVTSHTTSKVPFIITDKNVKLEDGKLGDIAPTILDLLKIEKPSEMTGNSLIKEI